MAHPKSAIDNIGDVDMSVVKIESGFEKTQACRTYITSRPEVTKILSFRNRRKTQVAAYIRVSSTMKAQEDSYENQRAYYKQMIKANPAWELVDVYGEKASGTHADNRFEFLRLLTDALSGKIDLVICKSISRWARNVVDGLQAIKLLTGNGVHIYFEQEGIDTHLPGVMLQMNIAASVAQSESESISENLKWSSKQRTRQGRFWANGGRYYGYDSKGNTFCENENSRYVRYIFKRYLECGNMTQIACELNRMGSVTVHGNPWQSSSVRYILSNEVYVGDVIFRKTPSRNIITGEVDADWQPNYVRDHHRGIVDRRTWEAVQAMLNKGDSANQRRDKCS